MNPAEKRIRDIIAPMWLTSSFPIFFQLFTRHQICENNEGTDNIRVGQGRVEFNTEWVMKQTDVDLKNNIIKEGMRILLGHPYARRKDDLMRNYIASDITLFEYLQVQMEIPNAKEMFKHLMVENMTEDQKKFRQIYENDIDGFFGTDEQFIEHFGSSEEKLRDMYNNIPTMYSKDFEKRHMEFYYSMLPNLKDNLDGLMQMYANGMFDCETDEGGDGNSPEDKTKKMLSIRKNAELFGDDPFISDTIKQLVQNAQLDKSQWGSLSGAFQERVIANLKPKADYKSMMRVFKKNVVSSETRLTRMRMNRRHPMKMGSTTSFTSQIVGYADTSGSVSSHSLKNAFAFLVRFLAFGVSKITIKQWDTAIKDNEVSLKKMRFDIKVKGRGGTDVTCVYKDIAKQIKENRYFGGAVIITDMEFSRPTLTPEEFSLIKRFKKKIIMVAENEKQYNYAKKQFHSEFAMLSFITPE